jgi:hypothetical protein
MDLLIAPSGEITTLYTEVLDLAALGAVNIQRVSHVEPDPQGQWWAQIIDGPNLGPFPRRSDALAAEVAWLIEHRLKGKAERGRRKAEV